MKEYVLTTEEKEKSLKLFEELDGDLSECTKKLFDDPNEKGSTVRGRALRKYWVEKGLSYRTKVKKRVVKHFLTDNEKAFIKNHYGPEMTKLEVGQLLWPEESKKKGFAESEKFIALCEYIGNEFPSVVGIRDDAAGEKYTPPHILTTAIKRLNKVAAKEFDINKLNLQDKKCVDVGIWLGISNAYALEKFNLQTTHGIDPNKDVKDEVNKLVEPLFNSISNMFDEVDKQRKKEEKTK